MNLKETISLEFYGKDKVRVNGKNMALKNFIKQAKENKEYNKSLGFIKQMWEKEKKKGYNKGMLDFIKDFFSQKSNGKLDLLLKNGTKSGNKKIYAKPEYDEAEFRNGQKISSLKKAYQGNQKRLNTKYTERYKK